MLYSLFRIVRVSAFISFFIFLSNRSQAATFTVSVGDDFFSPKNITVNVGDMVTWVWTGFAQHDVVANDGLFRAPLQGRGKTFSFTFGSATVGRHDYFCTPHQSIGMVGSVTVQAAANQSPTVQLTSPPGGATFSTTDTITFSANASDADGTVSKVEFFSDGNLIGAADTTSPYSVTGSLPAGQHSITAKATDNAGAATTSSAITITVNSPANQPPTVSLTAPANGATFLTSDTITFSADAGDDAGVNRVEFLSDGTIIGTDTSAPYSVSVALPAGQHTITARAFDGPGLSTTTSGITITVTAPQNNPPTITLSSQQSAQVAKAPATISLSAAATDDSGITQVEFFQDGVSLGSDTTAPYETTVQNLAAGVYNFTAVAHDNGGLATASTPVQIRVATEPHIDSITVNGAIVTVTATATTGINHDLEASSDFLGWIVVNSAVAANGSVTLHDTVVAANRFYRVVAR